MKIGYLAPLSIAVVNGGVRIQAEKTIEQVRSLGYETALISSWDKIEEVKPDLVHVFGAGIDTLPVMERIEALDIPLVLSPVFYSTHGSIYIKAALKIERLAGVLGAGLRSDFGVKAKACSLADLVLPNTNPEAELISRSFSVSPDKVNIVPNGVEKRFSDAVPDAFISEYDIKDFVLFTGQAGAPRKNVINLLKTATQIDSNVVIIGDLYDDEYGRRCKTLAESTDNVILINTLDHNSELLASAYAASKVFVLPSFYETPGIAALEAGLAGSNIVITKYGGTQSYFGAYAEFVDPYSENEILQAVNSSLRKEKSTALRDHILQNYTWDKVAAQTVEAYKTLVG